MNEILEKKQLSADVFQMRIRAPLIAQERRPGQFVIVQLDTDFGERIPLTIADADAAEGSITLIFQTVGKTTHRLADTRARATRIENLLGPLGRPTHIEKFGTVVCVGGGIGVAPLHPIAQGMKAAGNRVIVDPRRPHRASWSSSRDRMRAHRRRADRLHRRRLVRPQGPGHRSRSRKSASAPPSPTWSWPSARRS